MNDLKKIALNVVAKVAPSCSCVCYIAGNQMALVRGVFQSAE